VRGIRATGGWKRQHASGRGTPKALCVPKTLSGFWRNRIGQTGAMIALIWFVLAVLASPF
jgi:hypothetical protein